MAACLWQANPLLDNMQIADAIRQSASQYSQPDDLLGYGIPDFVLANNILTVINGPEGKRASVEIYPNPTPGLFYIDAHRLAGPGRGTTEIIIELKDISGRSVGSQRLIQAGSDVSEIGLLQNASAGIYFIKINLNGAVQPVQKVIKE
jgi:hypothetical protein